MILTISQCDVRIISHSHNPREDPHAYSQNTVEVILQNGAAHKTRFVIQGIWRFFPNKRFAMWAQTRITCHDVFSGILMFFFQLNLLMPLSKDCRDK